MEHFFDAHTHGQFAGFDADREAVFARAKEADVYFVNVGTQRDTSARAVEIADAAERGVYAAVGLHPVHTSKSYHDEKELGGGEAAKAFTSRGEVFDYDYYHALAVHPKTLAIGECGLDYFHFSDDESRDVQMRKQKDALLAQLALARDVQKPIMIHCRDAFHELIPILKEFAATGGSAGSSGAAPKPGVIHFFTGTKDNALALLDLGFSFTFGGVVTFTHDYDAAIAAIPIDRILSETDAPYVAPVPFRGKRNEPAYVIHTVAKLAELKGITPAEMKSQIWATAQRVFGKAVC
jgi:TatD DNase family protein